MNLAGNLESRVPPRSSERAICVGDVAQTRIGSIDLLRGLVMVLMALDHTRDFFGTSGTNPRDVADAGLSLTRWITHFCAPTFILLAGVSAYLYGTRVRRVGELSRFLLTRGLWLVLLELTVVRLGWRFNFDLGYFVFQVIWVIGASMVVLAALVYMPRWAIAAIGLGMIADSISRLGGAVEGAEPVWGAGERALVLAQGGARLSLFQQKIAEEFAQRHNVAGRHIVLVHRVFEIGGGAEFTYRLVVPAFCLRQYRRRGPALRLDLVGPIFVLGLAQRRNLFANPSKDKRIAALEAHHLQAGRSQSDHQKIDLFLADLLCPTTLADIADLCAGWGETKYLLADKVVV